MGKFGDLAAKLDITNKGTKLGALARKSGELQGKVGEKVAGFFGVETDAKNFGNVYSLIGKARETKPSLDSASGVLSNNSAIKEAIGNAGKRFIGDVVGNLDQELSKRDPNYRDTKREIIVGGVANKLVDFLKKSWGSLLLFGVSITLLITFIKYLRGRRSVKKSRF